MVRARLAWQEKERQHDDRMEAWETQVLADRTLPLLALHIVRLLRQHMSDTTIVRRLSYDGDRVANAKQQWIAERLGVCERTVRYALAALVQRGHLTVHRRWGLAPIIISEPANRCR